MIEELKEKLLTLSQYLTRSHEFFVPLARLYVARVFFLSGVNKVSDWDTTLFLFMNEYQVPLLPPVMAAFTGAFGELFFSVLLALGIQTRLSALALFFVNIVAVISYYSTLVALTAAFMDHIEWGIILGLLLSTAPCLLSVDYQWSKFRSKG